MKVQRCLDIRLLALCTTCILLPAIACPTQCICKWKNGKQHVECTDKNLIAIPDSLDVETQVLDFTGNDLQVLPSEIFHKLRLLNLQKINLQRCRLQKIDNHAFRGLTNLVELDLSNNHITVVPSNNFAFFPTLMKLLLNNNSITSVPVHCFYHLTYLNTLDLSNCKIEYIEQNAFSGLKYLEWLKLNNNRISTLQGDNVFPDTLRGIDLRNNMWNCDCNLRDLHEWIANFNIPHELEPVCSAPRRLNKRPIKSLNKFDLACMPKLSFTTSHIETILGSNVTLECNVSAVPEAKLQWFYQEQLIRNHSMSAAKPHHIFYIETGAVDKRSELFIFNIESNDNGTYSCVAENPAGKDRANYMINIVVQDEPVPVDNTFLSKHFVSIISILISLGLTATGFCLFKIITYMITRMKKKPGDDVALCNQNLSSNRRNETIISSPHLHHHALHSTVHSNQNYEPSNNIEVYIDGNPDLVNNVDIGNAKVENTPLAMYKTQTPNVSKKDNIRIVPATPRQVTWEDQQTLMRMHPMNMSARVMCKQSADVHLNPGYFLDPEGYPPDYGLPKHPYRQAMMSNYAINEPWFQTLPHSRPKGQKLVCGFAKDNEFSLAPSPCSNFEAFNAHRSLKGYPVSRNRPIAFVGNEAVYYDKEFVPSPPEGYKTEQTCTSDVYSNRNPNEACAALVSMGMPEGPGRCCQVETRCVDTQTLDALLPIEGADSLKPLPQVSNAKCALDVQCSESPDEGYEDM